MTILVSTSTHDQWAAVIRQAEVFKAVKQNEKDPWFLARVDYLLSAGFYFEDAWYEPRYDMRTVEAAWLYTAHAYLNGHRQAELGY